jgi:hypothetical protein
MHRVPNPPKLPAITMAETRSRGGLRAAKARLGAILLALLAASAPNAAEIRADETASDEAASIATETTAWPVATGNILVVGTDPSRAATIREHAETIRREAFSQLLGEAEPRPWLVRCEIHVHSSDESFEQAVGGSPSEARGATSLEFSGDRVVTRRIDVMGDGPAVVPDAIAHELVHVVLADHFVHAAPPRWADEGLALLFDSLEKQRGHEADFQDARRRGLAWSAADLLALDDYPADGPRQKIFYGQSASLVRWLIARRDAATFIRFLDEAAEIGMEAALDRHYAITSLVSVSSAWKEVAPINTLGLSDRRR